ncbi:MAG: hypothetical protein WC812_01650 [Candidatus Pacearchaeota archaeon]|jgi:protein-tyrosine-phosphatase
MNIIFVCKHNVFRSRVAETYFKQINKNPKIKISSGGLFSGGKNSPNQIIAMKKENVNPISKPKNLTIPFLKKQDLIIIVANDIPIKIFNNKDYIKKVINWKIPDVLNNNLENCYKTIKKIKVKVEDLVKELEK